MVTQMIGVGEQTGAMDAMLQKIADFYEDEVDAAVKDLLTALEPIMIVFLGVVVGGVVISMYLPLFSLIGKLSKRTRRSYAKSPAHELTLGRATGSPVARLFSLRHSVPGRRAAANESWNRVPARANGWAG